MEGRWNFNDLVAGQKIREAVQDEFFAADVIRGAADALVREGIQNSLDAAEEGQRVRVAIALGSLHKKEELDTLQFFLNGSWEHVSASDNGLVDPPNPQDHCNFLVFEDFGTSGLIGDPKQLLPIQNVDNRFFHFYRVEGRSDKHEDDRGRWGVGKQVFPRASRIKAVFGFTVRSDDDQCLLMGQAILRSHFVDGTYYQDGWFGKRRRDERPVFPLDDHETLDKFRTVFGLSRKNEPGLSLVVPYLLNDIAERDILASVLRGYFYPILMGDLEVILRIGASELKLDSENLPARIDELDADLRAEMRPVVNLAIWGKNRKDPLPESLVPDPETPPSWNDSILPEPVRAFVRENVRNHQPFGLRVPLMVRPRARGKPQRPSYFDVLMVRDDRESSGRPIFIREGIIVSDVRGHRSRGVRSIVVIDRGALATMLGDSENPAHTQWQRDGSKFKDMYYYGGAYIRFVADSVAEIVRISTQADDQEDLSLLSDIFSIPSEEGEEGLEEDDDSSKKGDKKKIEKPDFPKDSRPRFAVSPVEGGFTIGAASVLPPLPATVRVRVAYDVRRGNAFGKYNSADFKLERMDVKTSGAVISAHSENEMIVEVREESFGITVKGFDPNRDLRVSVVLLGDTQ